MLGWIGYAFWQFMCQKGYGFQICVPERVGFLSAKCVPERVGFFKVSNFDNFDSATFAQ